MHRCQPLPVMRIALAALACAVVAGCAWLPWPAAQTRPAVAATPARAGELQVPAASASDYAAFALTLRHSHYVMANRAQEANGRVTLVADAGPSHAQAEGITLKLTVRLALALAPKVA